MLGLGIGLGLRLLEELLVEIAAANVVRVVAAVDVAPEFALEVFSRALMKLVARDEFDIDASERIVGGLARGLLSSIVAISLFVRRHLGFWLLYHS